MARKKSSQSDIGPLPLVKTRLQRLPFRDEHWQVDFRSPPANPGMTILAILSTTTGVIRAIEVLEEPPSADRLWDLLAQGMQAPLADQGARPARISAAVQEVWEPLRPHLLEIGIELSCGEEMRFLDKVFDDVFASLNPPSSIEAVPLTAIEGLQPAQLGSFFEAAAQFHASQPWSRLEYEAAIEISIPSFTGGPWYGVVMGAAGLNCGLALYDDFQILERAWAEDLTEEEHAAEMASTAVSFGPREDMHKDDLKAIKRNGWKIAGPEAYPEPMRTEPGMKMRTPTAEEMRVLDASLRAVPIFVEQRNQEDETPLELTVSSPEGPLQAKLAWMPE